MAAYMIADYLEVSDPDGMAKYREAARDTIAAHGGKVIIAGPGEAVEGEWAPMRIVIIEFKDMAALRGWYNSPGYQAVAAIRHRSARENLIFAEGV